MTPHITGITVAVPRDVIDTRYRGALVQYRVDVPGRVYVEDEVITAAFDTHDEAAAWMERLAAYGIQAADVTVGNGSHPPAERFDVLSHSDSGLHYVRERKGGVMRVLTDSELADFSDPKPCPECAEQFGCDHYNCAGEPLLSEHQIEETVPREWTDFAREFGLSRHDLERLHSIERHEGEYRLNGAVTDPDMRLLELVLLLNDAR
jgi:hypothetical protein